jgi:hypothetical protein
MQLGKIDRVKTLVLPVREAALWAHEHIAVGGKYDVVVYETWRPRPIDGSMNWIQGDPLLSAQLVGQIRLCAWLAGSKLQGYGPDLKHVAVASMKGPASRAIKRRMAASSEQHDKDALMHLWYYFWRNWWKP